MPKKKARRLERLKGDRGVLFGGQSKRRLRCLVGLVGLAGLANLGRGPRSGLRAGEGVRTLDINLGKVALYH